MAATRVRGAEVEGKWDHGPLVRASYTRHVTEDSAMHMEPDNSPRDAVRAQVAVPIFGEKLSAGLELLYQSDRFTIRRDWTGDTWLINATLLSRELRPGLEISASLYNLLDARSRPPGGPEHVQDRLEQDGRTFRLKLSYLFRKPCAPRCRAGSLDGSHGSSAASASQPRAPRARRR